MLVDIGHAHHPLFLKLNPSKPISADKLKNLLMDGNPDPIFGQIWVAALCEKTSGINAIRQVNNVEPEKNQRWHRGQ